MADILKLFILFGLLDSCTLADQIRKVNTKIFNKNQLAFIYSYIIDDLIVEPSEFDVNPLLNSDLDTDKDYLLLSMINLDKNFVSRINSNVIQSLNKSNIQITENNFLSYSKGLIKSQLVLKFDKVWRGKAKVKLMDERCLMLIQFSNIQLLDKSYFIIVNYSRKYDELDDIYGQVRIYEFRKCQNGLIIFINSYEQIGCCDEQGDYMFDTKKIGSQTCD